MSCWRMILVFMAALLFAHVRQEGYVLRPLDGRGELALVLRAVPRGAAREQLAPRGDEGAQDGDRLVVDLADLLRAETADLPPHGRTAHAPAGARGAAAGAAGPAAGTTGTVAAAVR